MDNSKMEVGMGGRRRQQQHQHKGLTRVPLCCYAKKPTCFSALPLAHSRSSVKRAILRRLLCDAKGCALHLSSLLDYLASLRRRADDYLTASIMFFRERIKKPQAPTKALSKNAGILPAKRRPNAQTMAAAIGKSPPFPVN